MKRKILAVGSVALDSVRTPFGQVREALGGSASFFSAAARFFAPISVVAVVGRDFPRKYLALFHRLKIPSSTRERFFPDQSTFVSLIMTTITEK